MASHPGERITDQTFFHSVTLVRDKCLGCLNCLKRCPTDAIRIADRKAHIIPDFCIDCGECLRHCPHNARYAESDPMSMLADYAYKVALPAPSLYGQYNNLKDINILLTALTLIGFDDVFEVSAAAELVSAASRQYIDAHPEQWPLISSACPTIVRLIRIRFPNLLENLLPIQQPMEVAAQIARRRACEKTGLPAEQIGIFFISPCPSKVAAVRDPIGIAKSEVDGVIAVKDIYPLLLSAMPTAQEHPLEYALSGSIGVRWSCTTGEAKGQGHSHYVVADGIENVVRVLEDLEDEKLVDNVKFIELNSCPGGCIGGVLNVENPFVASSKLARLRKHLPASRAELKDYPADIRYATEQEIDFVPVYEIGATMRESMEAQAAVEKIMDDLPLLDCGMCGCPTCRSMAEDMVRTGTVKQCPMRVNGGNA